MSARARLFHYRRQVRALSAAFKEFEDADEVVDALYMPKSYKGKRNPRLRKSMRDRLLAELEGRGHWSHSSHATHAGARASCVRHEDGLVVKSCS